MWDPYEEFQKAVLPNGLTVYCLTWPKANFVRAGFLVGVGSREDPDDQFGLAHLVEHCVSWVDGKSLSDHKNFFCDQGGGANFGSTSIFSTQYSFFLPSQREILLQGLDIMGRIIFNPSLEIGLKKERSPVLNEFGYKVVSERLLEKQLEDAKDLFGEGVFSRRILGDKDFISRATLIEVETFHQRWYQPDNMALVMVGDVDIDRAIDLLNDSEFGSRSASGYDFSQRQVIAEYKSLMPKLPFVAKSSDFFSSREQGRFESLVRLPSDLSSGAVSLFRKALYDKLFRYLRAERGVLYSFSLNERSIPGQLTLLTMVSNNFNDEFFKDLSGFSGAIQSIVDQLADDEETLARVQRQRIADLLLIDHISRGVLNDVCEELEVLGKIKTTSEEINEHKNVSLIDFQRMVECVQPGLPRTIILTP